MICYFSIKGRQVSAVEIFKQFTKFFGASTLQANQEKSAIYYAGVCDSQMREINTKLESLNGHCPLDI